MCFQVTDFRIMYIYIFCYILVSRLANFIGNMRSGPVTAQPADPHLFLVSHLRLASISQFLRLSLIDK